MAYCCLFLRRQRIMDKATLAINDQIETVEAQIKNLGPLLWGTLKKNRVRRKRKDGSTHVSKPYHTFCYRDGGGKPCWKRIPGKALPHVLAMVKAGRAYKKLREQHARLLTVLSLQAPGPKKEGPCPPPGGRTSATSSGSSTPRRATPGASRKTSPPPR
jgi:hypothetical protein